MPDGLVTVVTFIAAVGCGVAAGVFFAFSAFIMRALDELPAPQAVATMKSINVFAVTPLFMAVLFGTATVCLVVAVSSLLNWHDGGAGYLLAGSLCYLFGTIVVTVVFNVPRNDRLAGVNPTSPEASRAWAAYVTTWTAWNHVRTAAAVMATALLMFALYLRRPDATP